MKVYAGQTRAARAIALCNAHGLGECVNRGELPPRRAAAGWFLDNGAFADWQNDRGFNLCRWVRDLRWVAYRLEAGELVAPDFVVVPDLVGQGAASLALSLDLIWWIPPSLAARCYLVVQEGMAPGVVASVLDAGHFAGLFVGGAAIAWKLGSTPTWVELAHARGLRCHVGRVGTLARLEAVRAMGADSVDSCLPLWTMERLEAFGAAAAQVTS